MLVGILQSCFLCSNFKPQACNLLKKKLWHRSFPVNFAKFLRNTFLYGTPPLAASFIALTRKHLLYQYWHSVGNLLSYSNLKTLLNLHGLLISFLVILKKKYEKVSLRIFLLKVFKQLVNTSNQLISFLNGLLVPRVLQVLETANVVLLQNTLQQIWTRLISPLQTKNLRKNTGWNK